MLLEFSLDRLLDPKDSFTGIKAIWVEYTNKNFKIHLRMINYNAKKTHKITQKIKLSSKGHVLLWQVK